MRACLRAGELVVPGSRRYSPWNQGLYDSTAWSKRRRSWFAKGNLGESATAYVACATGELDRLARAVAERLAGNTAARVEAGKLILDRLEGVSLAPEAEEARRSLVGLLPAVTLPDVLMEVDHWCGYSGSLLHLTAKRLPSPEHAASIRPALFAVLVAEATNLGLATNGHSIRHSLRPPGPGTRLVLPGRHATPVHHAAHSLPSQHPAHLSVRLQERMPRSIAAR